MIRADRLNTYICMDLDGVVYPFVHAWHRMAALNRIIAPEMADTTSVDTWAFYKDYGMETPEFLSMLNLWAPDLFTMCEPIGQGEREWKRLYRHNYIHVITSRPERATEPTLKWLDFWDLPFDRLTRINNTDKGKYIDNPQGKPVIAIDDLAKCLASYQSHGVGSTRLMRREYNRDDWSTYQSISSLEAIQPLSHIHD